MFEGYLSEQSMPSTQRTMSERFGRGLSFLLWIALSASGWLVFLSALLWIGRAL